MSEWQKVKLKDCCIKIGSGSTPKGGSMVYVNSGTSLIRSQNVYNLSFDYNGLTHITEDAANKLKGVTVFNEDILLNITGDSVARTCIVPKEVLPARVNQHVAIIRADRKKMNWRFLNYYLASPKMQAHMLSLAVGKGASRNAMTKQMIENFEVPYPPLSTQHRIATILSRYDSLIENYQKQIKLLEEAAQRLYKEWFVDLHFPGHENTKIIDGVPEGWELKSVTNNHLFNVAKCPIALFNGNKTYYATADVEGTYFCNSGVKIEYDNKPSRAQIQPSLYSVWFARMSNSFKIVGFVEQNNNRREDSILSSGFAGFESHYERFGFLYCLISSQWFNDQKNRYATGATQVSITNEGLSRIRCILPTTRLAEEFSLVTNKIIEETILYRENCIMLAEARDRLLPKLMSGEIEI